ncbi:MAG TPA: hypothetical protein VF605_01590 [Allosphingosinicella sp.]
MITISFEDQPLHDSCVDLHRAEQMFGSVHAAAIVTFISDAMAFDNTSEFIDFLGRDVQILPDDTLSVAIGSDYRAALVVAGKRFKRSQDGRISWTSVTRLKLVEISRLP